jgi:sigma-E factor negative regulatory protein RseA
MNGNHGETISALLDGELGDTAAQRALDALLEGDPDERARFGRYQLIGDLMRGEALLVSTDLAAGVGERLQQEPHILVPVRRERTWLRPVAGAALAASVAAGAVMVAPQLLGPATHTPAGSQLASTPLAPAAPLVRVAAGDAGPVRTVAGQGRWNALDSELAERLNRLVLEHHEFGGRTGINGPVAHIGLVSYDPR